MVEIREPLAPSRDDLNRQRAIDAMSRRAHRGGGFRNRAVAVGEFKRVFKSLRAVRMSAKHRAENRRLAKDQRRDNECE